MRMMLFPVGARSLVIATSLVVGAAMSAGTAHASPPPDFSRLPVEKLEQRSSPHSWKAHADMVAVPAGRYTLGDLNGPPDQRPPHQVELAAFRIDRTEVTNAAFAEYLNALGLDVQRSFEAGRISSRDVAAAGYALLHEGASVYPIVALDDDQALIGAVDGRFAPKPGYERHPVTETTWAGARAYCEWRGGRLPTEAEWEAAARGPDARRYPWGDAPPTDELAFVSGRTGVTSPVGVRPKGASAFGAQDMAGSMAEWTSSLKFAYPYVASDGREARDAPGERVTRGGDYVFDTEHELLTATHRNGFSNAPDRGHRHIGFRCAADGPSS